MEGNKKLTDRQQKIACYKIRMGNILIQLDLSNLAGWGNHRDAIPRAYQPFVVQDGTPDIIIRINQGEIPELDLKEKEKIFDWGGPLSLYKSNGKFIVPFIPNSEPLPRKVAIFEEDFEQGDIYLQSISRKSSGSKVYSSEHPFKEDLDEFLFLVVISLLGLGRGILVHGCGIIKEGKSLVFAGISGAGKSTLANLWKERKDVTILGDDRLIVGKENGGFQTYGTFWHSDAGVYSPRSAPLEKIYFIEHAPKNYVRLLKNFESGTRLLVRTFPPLFNAKGMKHTLGFCAELAENIPNYKLGFFPDKNIVDFIEKHLEGGDGH